MTNLNSSNYKYSRLKETITKIDKSQIPTNKIPLFDTFQCPNCFNNIAKTSLFCPECGLKIIKCPICKSTIKNHYTIGQCPQCKEKFHLEHLKESVKVSGPCPICKIELNDQNIIII